MKEIPLTLVEQMKPWLDLYTYLNCELWKYINENIGISPQIN